MKKLNLLTVLFVLGCTHSFAQDVDPKKLNNIQTTGIWAPSPVKIDGKLNEWHNGFKAYNRSTRLLYILSNDDKNIYLVVKSTDFTTQAKIIAGGVNLIINTDGKKDDKGEPSVTFPMIEHPERLAGNMNSRFESRDAGADTELMHALHERTIIAAKQIRVLGIKSIVDTLISIYNMDGAKAALNFDPDGGLTLEMAISLKSINITPDDARELAYHVVLNGYQIPGNNSIRENGPGGGMPPAGAIPTGGGGVSFGGATGGATALNFMDLMTPSDFWGKYTLAKK
jgi:hypothetical protein